MVQGLRLRGVDLITAYEDGADEIDDDELLDRATSLGRALFSNAALPPASGVLMPGRCGLLFTELSRDAEDLVRLQAQPPLWMREAVVAGAPVLASPAGPSIGCRKKCSKSSAGSAAGSSPVLREDQLQLVSRAAARIGPGLRADADPVDAGRRRQGAVGLDGDLEAPGVQRVDQRPSSCSIGSPPVQTT